LLYIDGVAKKGGVRVDDKIFKVTRNTFCGMRYLSHCHAV